MKANELRIGNLVMFGNNNTDNIEEVKAVNYSDWFNDGKKYWLETNHCEGELLEDFTSISLTEEWLLKFGFTKSLAVTNFAIQIEAGVLDLTPSEIVGYHVYIDDNWICTIESVHELQNLYFALTGQELNIN
jgi:hypothetical protein